jgi:uncharacterized phiE125 gp8 family phage protein
MRYRSGCGNYFQYKIVTPPAALPIDLDFLKLYLKIDDTTDDALLTFLIKAAASFVENYTNRTLINTQYLTYRDNFGFYPTYFGYFNADCCGIELRKSRFVSLDSFTYKNLDGIDTVVDPTIYYVTDEIDYSSIMLNPDQQYPQDVRCARQAVKILFTAGYGTTQDDIPPELQEVMLQLIADMYSNRGDCMPTGRSCACSQFLTGASKALLDQYRIIPL